MQNLKIKDKQALATPIFALLVILIVAVSISILYFIIQSLSPSFSPAVTCNDLIRTQSIIILKACYNTNSKDVEVVVQREGGENISALEFTIDSQDLSNWRCGMDCGNCRILDKGEMKTYYFNLVGFNPIKIDGSRSQIALAANGCNLGVKKVLIC